VTTWRQPCTVASASPSSKTAGARPSTRLAVTLRAVVFVPDDVSPTREAPPVPRRLRARMPSSTSAVSPSGARLFRGIAPGRERDGRPPASAVAPALSLPDDTITAAEQAGPAAALSGAGGSVIAIADRNSCLHRQGDDQSQVYTNQGKVATLSADARALTSCAVILLKGSAPQTEPSWRVHSPACESDEKEVRSITPTQRVITIAAVAGSLIAGGVIGATLAVRSPLRRHRIDESTAAASAIRTRAPGLQVERDRPTRPVKAPPSRPRKFRPAAGGGSGKFTQRNAAHEQGESALVRHKRTRPAPDRSLTYHLRLDKDCPRMSAQSLFVRKQRQLAAARTPGAPAN